ncbi:MAG: hypothetical protein LBD36_02220 [Holosporales bacterium]|nr:hypothetical protein [Holosporales bacterium]
MGACLDDASGRHKHKIAVRNKDEAIEHLAALIAWGITGIDAGPTHEIFS